MQERKDKPLDPVAEEKSLEAATALAFPTPFPLKIMGRKESGFTTAAEAPPCHFPEPVSPDVAVGRTSSGPTP